MSGTGRVLDVESASVPDTDAAAQKVVVEGQGGRWLCFYIPLGPAPAAGETIGWGPHHAWWPGCKVAKLTWEQNLFAPLR